MRRTILAHLDQPSAGGEVNAMNVAPEAETDLTPGTTRSTSQIFAPQNFRQLSGDGLTPDACGRDFCP
jgi:hypothetical protein